mmetsp:Transcript_3168/g.7227  ORF Transcript_3168/g.7227 Transcript_3168/m.7227 type:complete len:180 (+) Transcript_3168:148-687(+)
MKQQATMFAIVCCALNTGVSQAFISPSVSAQHRIRTSLNLVPDQGNQLVAAYNAISLEKRSETAAAAPIQVDRNFDESENPRGAIAASKRFLTRIFHKPATEHPGEGKNNDVVYYPMVGFRFFEGIDSVFPTTSNVSCDMPTKSQKEEEVFGWFSLSCKLDLYSEDVCRNPEDEECILD